MAKYLKLLIPSSGTYSSTSYRYPYVTNKGALTADALYPPMPYYIGGTLIRGVNGITYTGNNLVSGGNYVVGIGYYEPENFTSLFVGINSTSYNIGSNNTEISFNSPVSLQEFKGDYTLPSATYKKMDIREIDGVDVGESTYKPIITKSLLTVLNSDINFFDLASARCGDMAYYIDVNGVYGDFPFIGIIVCPYTNDLYFISNYPDLSETANPNCGDLPDGLSYYGFTLDNILYGLNESDYLKVDLDNDDLQDITFSIDAEIPLNFYEWLTGNYNEVYTGHYVFKTYSGDVIADLTEKQRITHYAFSVNGDYKTLTLTYFDGTSEVITWSSTTPIDGYSFQGMSNNGILTFTANGSGDVDIYGDYEFVEVWEKQILPSDDFTLNLYHNASDPKVVEKDLEGVLDIEGALKEACSILDPVIMIQTDQFDDLMKCNYCYIEKFKRYYYINNIEIYRTDLYILHLHVDVLMSYKDMILFSNAFIVRTCGSEINMAIQDPLIVTGSNEEIEIRKVGSGSAPYYETGSIIYPTGSDLTDPNYCWILTVLGE